MKFACNSRPLLFLCLYQSPAKLRAGSRQFLAVGNIKAAANVASKGILIRKARYAGIDDPAVLAISASKAVFHRKFTPCIEGRKICLHTVFQVIRVDTLHPSIPKLLLQSASGKIQPASIEVIAKLIKA